MLYYRVSIIYSHYNYIIIILHDNFITLITMFFAGISMVLETSTV